MMRIAVRSRLPLLLSLGALVLSACASVLVGTQPWFDEHSAGRRALSKRASFDLSCAEDALTYTGLGSGQPYTAVGVSGCGKKASYVYLDHSSQGTWVLNSEERAGDE